MVNAVTKARGLIVALTLLSTAAAAQAQEEYKHNIFIGYSHSISDLGSGTAAQLNGFDVALLAHFKPWLAIVGDINFYFGTATVPIRALCRGITFCTPPIARANVFTTGPEWGLRVLWPRPKFRPFMQVLIGASDVRANARSFSQWETSFAEVFTAGLEYRFSDHFSWQADAGVLQTHFFTNSQNNFRFSLGPVL